MIQVTTCFLRKSSVQCAFSHDQVFKCLNALATPFTRTRYCVNLWKNALDKLVHK